MNHKKVRTALSIFTGISALIALISALSGPLLALYLSSNFNIDTRNAASVGIIGGADGPTAIFLSGNSALNTFAVIFAALAILGLIVLAFTRSKKPQD